MKMAIKQLQAQADDAGVTVDELINEMKKGGNTSKPYTVAISFNRMSEMLEFARIISGLGVGIYHADGLDPEFRGRGGGNRFVIRSTDPTQNGKPESWRIDSDKFVADELGDDEDDE